MPDSGAADRLGSTVPYQYYSRKVVDVAKDPGIIAHAILESDQTTDGFVEFTLPLEYRDLERKPKYVVVSACASSLGDYFTGGVGSVLHVDEFEFLYE